MDKMKSLKIAIYCILSFCFLLLYLLMCDGSKKLGSGFTYFPENKHILGEIDIPPIVLSYDYNNHFIIAKQKPKQYHEAIYDKMEYIYTLGRDTTYYWLIIKQDQKFFGPLDYDSFQKLKKEYNVPDNLKLNKPK